MARCRWSLVVRVLATLLARDVVGNEPADEVYMLARQRYAQRGRGLQSGTAPWAPIRIHVHEGTFDSSLSSATRTYLTGQLLPAAIDWLHHALCTPQDRSFSASPPLLHARSVAATFA
jgi:hypothetical protein